MPPTQPEDETRSLLRWLQRFVRLARSVVSARDAQAATLSSEQIDRLDRQLQAWAMTHPQPSRRIFGFASGTMLSPLEIADAVHNRTPDGMKFLRVVGLALKLERVPFEEFLRSFPTEGAAELIGREH